MSGYHTKFNNCNNDGPDAQLRIAVQRRDCKVAQSLLNNGAQINYPHARPCHTILHLAMMNQDVEMVKILLDSGVYLNNLNACGETALHLATKHRDVNLVQMLLDRGANVDIPNTHGKTALHLAVERGSERIVKLLVENGANVNTIAKNNSRPIKRAFLTWRNNIFKVLVDHSANVDITLNNSETLLHRAIKNRDPSTVKCILENSSVNKSINKYCLITAVLDGNEKIVQLLIKHGFEIEPQCVNNSQFFHTVVARGYINFVTDLLTMGADVNALRQETTKYTLLHTACIHRKLEITKLLIQHDIDLNLKDNKEKTAIFYAVRNNDFNIVKLLITNGAHVQDDPDLLKIAAHNQRINTVEILLEHGVNINAYDSSGKTVLHSVLDKLSSKLNNDLVYKIKASLIRVLLNKGSDVNMPMNDGRTALHLAVQTNNEKIVNTLLEYNAKVNVSDAKGITPLHLAAQTKIFRKSNIVESLLSKDADITAVDMKGTTALHFAAEVGHLDIIKNLLKYEPNINAMEKFSSTTLHFAAKYGYFETINCVDGQGSTALLIAISHLLSLECINELLKFGADVNYRNIRGETALHIAAKMKRREIIEILLRYGADINIKCHRNKTALFHTYEYKSPKFRSSPLCDFDYDHFSCHVNECFLIVEIFKRHILKLHAVKLYVNKGNIQASINFDASDQSDSDRNSFLEGLVADNSKRNMELMSMKNERIGNSNITFYNFLTCNIHRLARYVKNKNIAEVINSNDYKLIFPIFSDIIESRFHIGIERNKLLARCEFLGDIFVDLPDICIDVILSYLNNQELRFLTNAYKNQYNILNRQKIFLNS